MSPAFDRDSSSLGSASFATFSSEHAVLNSSQLLDRCLGNIELAERVLNRFVDTLPGELEQMERFVVAGDGEQVRAAAHRLKGAAANIAAARLESRLETLESVASQTRIEDATRLINELGVELRRLADEAPPWRTDVDNPHT